jgi:hypothetical protein
MFGRSRRPRPPRPPEPPPAAPIAQDIPIEEMFVGGDPSPFTVDEEARIKRNEAAAALLDEDTMGYVVIRLKKNGGNSRQGRSASADTSSPRGVTTSGPSSTGSRDMAYPQFSEGRRGSTRTVERVTPSTGSTPDAWA